MRILLVMILASLALTACSSGGGEDPTSAVAINGYVHAGPTCPVIQSPPDPACEDRPVSGALIDFVDSEGRVAETITSDADDYARQVERRFLEAGIRTEIDLRNEKINYKVREHSLAKVPIIAVAGRREAEESTVALRRLGSKEQEFLALDDAVARIRQQAAPPTGAEI